MGSPARVTAKAARAVHRRQKTSLFAKETIMRLTSALSAPVLGLPLLAYAAPPSGDQAQLVKVPANASLAGLAVVKEIHAVAVFDQEFKQSGYQMPARVETPSATAWTVRRRDGTVANAVVRKTSPTTIELTEAAAASATVPTPRP
jgi:hypothetical protein